jgi:TPR repeat protein
MRPRQLLTGVLLLVTGFQLGAAPVSALAPAEIERRNAAATFVQTQELTLQMLRAECGTLMPTESARVDSIARTWFDRNKGDIVSTRVWLDQYLAHAKTISAEQYQRESGALLKTLSSGIIANAKTHFHRQPPSAEGCANALRAYSAPAFDIQNVGNNKGYAQFAEFGKTLRAVREAADYAVPPQINTQFQENVPFQPFASLEAASAARERGDQTMMRTLYTRLAEHGEGTAAHAMGLSYLTADPASRDYALAYRWFAAAWSLGNLEGLNALGVLLRDGVSQPANTRLAYGAFLLAQQGARDQNAFDRSQRNAQGMLAKISDADRTALACMTINGFDAALQTPDTKQALVPSTPIVQGQRTLGQIVPALASAQQTACP